MKCIVCGKTFGTGNDADGIPNGIGIVKNGKVVNVCRECIEKAATDPTITEKVREEAET